MKVKIKTLNGIVETEVDDAVIKREENERLYVERTRPLTEQEVLSMLIPQQINMLSVDDNTALRMKSFYPAWMEGQAYTVGFKLTYGGKLWRVLQAHTSQAGWEPSTATASLFEQIEETHVGTIDDPIPYSGNMALEQGKYYMQDYTIYLCIDDTINPVYAKLSELAGRYTAAV